MSWYDFLGGGEEFKAQSTEDREAARALAAQQQQNVINPGTSYQTTEFDQIRQANGTGNGKNAIWNGADPRDYIYGRNPGAADSAVNRAFSTGDAGMQVGQFAINSGAGAQQLGAGLLNQRTGDAQHFDARHINQGDFGAQNQTLGYLGGLEATQGPSAAQAQLQTGTNQALNSQLALARSGHGFGGGAAAMGLAQGNTAGIQANQANQSGMLRAQEDAAWRGRQAANLGTVAGQQGQQVSTNLQAGLAGQAQNDAMTSQMLGLGQDAAFKGYDAQNAGYQTALGGVGASIGAQGVANQVRGTEQAGSLAHEDNVLREWAARNGFTLAGQQAQDQKNAGYIQAGATAIGSMLGS